MQENLWPDSDSSHLKTASDWIGMFKEARFSLVFGFASLPHACL